MLRIPNSSAFLVQFRPESAFLRACRVYGIRVRLQLSSPHTSAPSYSVGTQGRVKQECVPTLLPDWTICVSHQILGIRSVLGLIVYLPEADAENRVITLPVKQSHLSPPEEVQDADILILALMVTQQMGLICLGFFLWSRNSEQLLPSIQGPIISELQM